MSSLSAPLQRSLVAEDALSTLRYETLTDELKEGEYLREVAISKRMDVSRDPVRRTLQQLKAEGLVACEENGRTGVIGTSDKDIDGICELRLILEKRTIFILQNKDIMGHTPILNNLNQLKLERDKGEECTPVKMAALGYDVHVAIMRCSGNKAIFNARKSLSSILQLIMEISGNYVGEEWTFNSHKALVDAIVQKRPDLGQIIEWHMLEDSKNIYLNELQVNGAHDG